MVHIIQDFLLFPKSKREPLSVCRQMRDTVRFVTWKVTLAALWRIQLGWVGSSMGQTGLLGDCCGHSGEKEVCEVTTEVAGGWEGVGR